LGEDDGVGVAGDTVGVNSTVGGGAVTCDVVGSGVAVTDIVVTAIAVGGTGVSDGVAVGASQMDAKVSSSPGGDWPFPQTQASTDPGTTFRRRAPSAE
jgi:hypothetical protein